MLRITQLKLPITHTETELPAKAAKLLRIPREAIRSYQIVKQSIDARKKDQLLFIYTLDVEAAKEEQIVKKAKNPQIAIAKDTVYHFPTEGKNVLDNPPVIVGSGPAGLFCGLMLAQAGFCPVILERGGDVDMRRRKVEKFWEDGILDARSNVQFGEGGAGTFSDGKLNTMVKDPVGRNKKVLEILVEHGADPSILYDSKPHIGTDVLGTVVKNIRQHIIALGGKVVFGAHVTEILVENGNVAGVLVEQRGNQGSQLKSKEVQQKPEDTSEIKIPANAVVLAIGHSARDTFSMLLGKGIPMVPKSFAVGLRIQHPQKMIDVSQYGRSEKILGPAPYKVTHQTTKGRGVYSFCMCPGGFVVDASSEKGLLAVNGMSNHDRGSDNANSALIVTVTPDDFEGDSPLAGVEYQRKLEKLAYQCGAGKIPVQLYGDFKEGKLSQCWGDVVPQFKGRTQFANMREILPEYLSDSIIEGVEAFEQKIRGFSRYDSILAGVESRTSSPVRILRNDCFESEISGLFPCGEGAGYAGGITSAAMDGMKVAEEIGQRYRGEMNREI